MFLFLQRLVEERIKAAQERGAFDNLPGHGKPLELDEDRQVPEDLRLAYRVLRNSNCLPPELELHREILTLQDLLRTIGDEHERASAVRRVNFLILKLNMLRGRPIALEISQVYGKRLAGRLSPQSDA